MLLYRTYPKTGFEQGAVTLATQKTESTGSERFRVYLQLGRRRRRPFLRALRSTLRGDTGAIQF